MDQAEFDALKATFPWTERITPTPLHGGLVQVINNRDEEVPLFTITRFLNLITTKLAAKAPEAERAAA